MLIQTLEPVRRSLTLANTRSPKSLSLYNNDRSLIDIFTITTQSIIHECDKVIVGNNSDNKDKLSSFIDESNSYPIISNETKSLERFTDSFAYKDFVRQGLIVPTFSSSTHSTIRTTTVTSLTSTTLF